MFKKLWNYIKDFVKCVIKTTWNKIKEFIIKWDSILIMIASTIGFTTIFQMIPFYVFVPMWMETSAIAPVLGCLLTYILVSIPPREEDYELAQ